MIFIRKQSKKVELCLLRGIYMCVTVIIVNYNAASTLRKCLECLSLQTLKPARIILIDNASRDDSLDCVKDFSQVELICLDENTGFAKGNNIALKMCDTKYAALVNPDVYATANWLETLVKAAEEHPDYGSFASRQMSAENDAILDGAGDGYTFYGRPKRRGHGCNLSEKFLQRADVFSACAAAALYRLDAVREAGFFDEDYFCYIEDIDLGFRLQLLGYKCLYVSEAIVQHVGSVTTGGQHSDFSVYYGHRNIIWTYAKNMPGLFFLLFLPIHIMMNFGAIALYTIKRRSGVIVRSKLDGVRSVKDVMGKRRIIQKNRRCSLRHIQTVINV